MSNSDIVIESVGKHVYLQFEIDGEAIFRKPLAGCIREYLEPIHQKDIDSGQVAKGFQPETALAKVQLSRALNKELQIA